jgi:anti-anti-sigma regulatory factor
MEIEGKLAGNWVHEALETWTKLASAGSPITADLSGVTSVDASGRRLLSEMHARGVRLLGSTLLTRGLIEEITS